MQLYRRIISYWLFHINLLRVCQTNLNAYVCRVTLLLLKSRQYIYIRIYLFTPQTKLRVSQRAFCAPFGGSRSLLEILETHSASMIMLCLRVKDRESNATIDKMKESSHVSQLSGSIFTFVCAGVGVYMCI